MALAEVHVVPKNGKWATKMGQFYGPSYDTQAEAIGHGRRLAENEGRELVIHGEDGQIREKDSHGHDPEDVPG